MKNEDLISRLYSATNQGLGIIKKLCPDAEVSIPGQRAKYFKLRPDERTASAVLYPPKPGEGCYHVKDYGRAESPYRLSPIDLFASIGGINFSEALKALAGEYGITDSTYHQGANKPRFQSRPLHEGEKSGDKGVELLKGFLALQLRVWGPRVKAEHLQQLGWSSVSKLTTVKMNKVTEIFPTDTYPIFAQTCKYKAENGKEETFQKVYQPLSQDKSLRFQYIGSLPHDYLFGLDALKEAYYNNDRQKLDYAVLVSGGSDAVNCLSMGYQPVWLNSETADFTKQHHDEILKYAKCIVQIPDTDTTGIKVGRLRAFQFFDMSTLWLPKDLLAEHKDWRGNPMKDLKDYITITHGDKKEFDKFISQALSIKFWEWKATKKDAVEGEEQRGKYKISRVNLYYLFKMLGYNTLSDTHDPNQHFIHIDGVKVKNVYSKSIVDAFNKWMVDNDVPIEVQNLVRRSQDLPNDRRADFDGLDLDFTPHTPNSQRLYFSNKWIEVTADSIVEHVYEDVNVDNKYVWEDSIIPHKYKAHEPMFTISVRDDGTYYLDNINVEKSELFQFLILSSRLYWREEDEQGMTLTNEQKNEEMQCLVSKMAALGYLLHSYKSVSLAYAIICQDYKIGSTENDRNGRNGKSFFLKAISNMHGPNADEKIDCGQQKSLESVFLFGGVNENTKMVSFEECPKNFNYGAFFEPITGSLRVEQKNRPARTFQFHESPKFAFITNYVLLQNDGSTRGRFWDVVFGDFFHDKTKSNDYRETRSIRDYFGHNLLEDEYPEDKWSADIAFMIQCLQFYLSLPDNKKKQMPPMHNIEQRQLLSNMGDEFTQWADEYFLPEYRDVMLKYYDVQSRYKSESGDNNMSSINFTKKLKAYCKLKNYTFNPKEETGNKVDGERWRKRCDGKQVYYIYIKST